MNHIHHAGLLIAIAIGLGLGNFVIWWIAWLRFNDRVDYVESKCNDRWNQDHRNG